MKSDSIGRGFRHWLFLISLALVGIVTTTVGIVSFYVPMCVGGNIDRSKWACVHFYEGRIRLFLLEQPTGSRLQVFHQPMDPRGDFPRPFLLLYFGETEGPLTLEMLQSGEIAHPRNWRIMISSQSAIRPFTLQMPSLNRAPRANRDLHVNLLRFPVWVLSVLMVIPPALGALRGPITQRLRRRRNLCTVCGYDPTGNLSDICPECGQSLAAPPEYPLSNP